MTLQDGYFMYLKQEGHIYIYISLVAVFDEDFTSPISIHDLPFQGAIKLRNIKGHTNMYDSELITKETGPVNGEINPFLRLQVYHTLNQRI